MTMDVRLTVNGREASHAVEPRMSLADLLRGPCDLTGTHLGCEHGVCGACTVVVDGAPMRSCITYAVQTEGRRVQTIEAFDDDPVMEELRDAFRRHHALQCGFCTPGMLITARDIVTRLPGADEARVREELGGNLCRCTGYVGIVAAVLEVAARARPAMVDRAPPDAPLPAAPIPAAAPTGAVAPAPPFTTTIREAIVLPHGPEQVWMALSDLEAVAACLPGASLTKAEGALVEGGLRVRFGPIASRFEFRGTQERDEARRRGSVQGDGRDPLTGSRAQGRIDFTVVEGSEGGSRLEVELGFSLQGTLAQFSRGALVRDLARQLIAQFASDLSVRISGGSPAAAAAPAELNSLALALRALRDWISRLLGGRS